MKRRIAIRVIRRLARGDCKNGSVRHKTWKRVCDKLGERLLMDEFERTAKL